MDVLRGTATVRSFLLETGEAQLEATGTVALGDETASLVLVPVVREPARAASRFV